MTNADQPPNAPAKPSAVPNTRPRIGTRRTSSMDRLLSFRISAPGYSVRRSRRLSGAWFGIGDVGDDDVDHPAGDERREGLAYLSRDLRQWRPEPGHHADLDLSRANRHA